MKLCWSLTLQWTKLHIITYTCCNCFGFVPIKIIKSIFILWKCLQIIYIFPTHPFLLPFLVLLFHFWKVKNILVYCIDSRTLSFDQGYNNQNFLSIIIWKCTLYSISTSYLVQTKFSTIYPWKRITYVDMSSPPSLILT